MGSPARPGQTRAAPLASRRRATTRAQLIHAAGELFDETGTTGAGVADVCSRAGYTRGAFYSNFSSMDELYLALCSQRAEAFLDQLEDELADHVTSAPGQVDLDRAVDDVVAVLALEPTWVAARSVLVAQAVARPAAAQLLREHHQAVLERLGPLARTSVQAAGRELAVPEDQLARDMLVAYDGAMLHGVLYPDQARSVLRNAVKASLLSSSREIGP